MNKKDRLQQQLIGDSLINYPLIFRINEHLKMTIIKDVSGTSFILARVAARNDQFIILHFINQETGLG